MMGKTTGAGKRVRAAVYMGQEAYVAKKDWLGRGLELVSNVVRRWAVYLQCGGICRPVWGR